VKIWLFTVGGGSICPDLDVWRTLKDQAWRGMRKLWWHVGASPLHRWYLWRLRHTNEGSRRDDEYRARFKQALTDGVP